MTGIFARRRRRRIIRYPIVLLIFINFYCCYSSSSSSTLGQDDAKREPLLLFDALQKTRITMEREKRNGQFHRLPRECVNHTSTHDFFDPLACWLRQFQLHIPDQSFRAGLLHMAVTNFTCTNFALQNISATQKLETAQHDDNNTTSPVLSLEIAQLSADCQGQYAGTGGIGGNVHAHIQGEGTEADNDKYHQASASVYEAGLPALSLVVQLESRPVNDTNGSHNNKTTVVWQPHALHTQNISLFLNAHIRFDGSASAQVVDLFRHTIGQYVSRAVQTQVPPLVQQNIDPIFTEWIQKLTDYLEPYVRLGGDDDDDDDSNNNCRKQEVIPPRIQDLTSSVERGRPHVVTSNEAKWNSRFQSSAQPSASSSLSSQPLWEARLADILKRGNEWMQNHWERGFLPLPALTACGGPAAGIRGMLPPTLTLRSNDSLGGGGTMEWPGVAALDLSVQALSLGSIREWEKLVLLQPTAATVPNVSRGWTTDLSTPNLEGTVNLTLTVRAIPGGLFSGDDLRQSIRVRANFTQVNLQTLVRPVWNESAVRTIPLSALASSTTTNNISNQTEGCNAAWQLVEQINVDSLFARVQFSDLEFFATDGSSSAKNRTLEQDLDGVLNVGLQVVLRSYPLYISRAIAGLVGDHEGPVQTTANQWLANYVDAQQESSSCNGSYTGGDYDSNWPHVVNFTKTPLPLLSRWLQQTNTLRGINEYWDCAAQTVVRASQDWIQQFSLPWVDLQELTVQGAGSVDRLQLLDPNAVEAIIPGMGNDGTRLWSQFDYNRSSRITGSSHYSGNSPIPQMLLRFTVTSDSGNSSWNSSFQINDIHMTAGTDLRYDVHSLGELSPAKALERPICWLAPLNELDVYEVTSSWSTIRWKVEGIWGNRSVTLDTDDYPEVQQAAEAALIWVLHTFRDGLKLASLSVLDKSATQCNGDWTPDKSGHHNDDTDSSIPNLSSILLVVAACFLLAQPALLLLKPSSRDDQPEETDQIASALVQPLLGPGLTDTESHIEEEPQTKSLMHQAPASELVQVLTAVAILGTMALLLASNLSVGATVSLDLELEDNQWKLPALFAFSLGNTARDMWNAEIYPLFFLVLFFSGLWPYVKLGLMLLSWIAPEEFLSTGARGRLLLALDALGKFSLVDTYVLVLMVVAFRYHLEATDSAVLDVYVTPCFGFYGFLLATMLSLLLGHALVYYHRRTAIASRAIPGQATELTESVGCHYFRVGEEKQRLSRSFRYLFSFLLVSATTLLAVGMSQESFEFDIGGVAGMIVDDESSIKTYSLFSLGLDLPRSVDSGSQIGIRFLQIVFFFYAAVAPFMCLVFLAVLFVCPMSVPTQFAVLTLAEVANAWSAVEVFALSIVVSLFEISTFARFIVGKKCDVINVILSKFLQDGDNACYSVASRIHWNVLYLLIGATLNSTVVSFGLKVAQLAMEERTLATSHVQRSMVERLSKWQWTSWMLQLEPTTIDDESVGPPINAAESIVEPPANRVSDGLASEWSDEAERDPEWKRWKETTSVT